MSNLLYFLHTIRKVYKANKLIQILMDEPNLQIIRGEPCPMCMQKTLTLVEQEREIPYFGLVFLFSMNCTNPDCGYHKADIEPAQTKDPQSVSFTVESEDDLSVRVVKAASATVKLPRIMTMESTEMSNGYVTNIEGILNRAKKVLEGVRDTSDDSDEVKKAKNHIKKLQRVIWGKDPLTITIDDPTGSSGIISEKAVIKKLKKK